MRDVFQPTVYLIASHRNGTLYTGVTSNLLQRIWEHREAARRGFATRYGVKRLLWFEQHEVMETAILREKRIKKWNRDWKIRLLEELNPDWRDLAVDFGFEPLPSQRTDRSGDGFPPSRE